MPLNPASDWKTSLEQIKKVDTPDWPVNLAKWYDSELQPIEPDPSIFLAVGFKFTFNQPIFMAKLMTAVPTPDPVLGAMAFADAWEAGLLASIVVMGPGSALLPQTPATLFSVVATTIVDPASVALGKLEIIKLGSSPQPKNPEDAEFYKVIHAATKNLTITISGTNSITPTPAPFVAAAVPLT